MGFTVICCEFSLCVHCCCFIRVIRNFHEGMMAQVLDSGEISDPFCVSNGTKQGCVLDPLLFSIYFSMMLQVAFHDCSIGVPIQFRTDGSVFNLRRLQSQTKIQSNHRSFVTYCLQMIVHYWLTPKLKRRKYSSGFLVQPVDLVFQSA